jgi:hypothetical protein
METTWLETLIAALIASFKFAITVPFFILKEELNFWESLLFGISSGTFGIIVFMFLSSGLLRLWNWFKLKTGLFKRKKPRKVFSKRSRRWVKVKSKFGLFGIAFLTPIILSIPIGCFIAMRYYKNNKKVFIYLFVSVVVWSVIFASFGSAMLNIINSFKVV